MDKGPHCNVAPAGAERDTSLVSLIYRVPFRFENDP